MLGFQSHMDYETARKLLRDAGYSYDAMVETLSGDEWFTPRLIDMPRFDRMLNEPSERNTFIRFFLLGQSVAPDKIQKALHPMELDSWIQAGLIRPIQPDQTTSAAIRLTPVDDWLVASDSRRHP